MCFMTVHPYMYMNVMLLLNIDGDITHRAVVYNMTFTFSPKQNGKHDEGWMILKQVHDTNMRAKGYPEKVFSVSICEKNSQCSHGSPRQTIK